MIKKIILFILFFVLTSTISNFSDNMVFLYSWKMSRIMRHKVAKLQPHKKPYFPRCRWLASFSWCRNTNVHSIFSPCWLVFFLFLLLQLFETTTSREKKTVNSLAQMCQENKKTRSSQLHVNHKFDLVAPINTFCNGNIRRTHTHIHSISPHTFW